MKLFHAPLKFCLALLVNALAIASIAQAAEFPTVSEETHPFFQDTDALVDADGVSQGKETDGMDRVSNVSQLRDVELTDWAFEALRSLVERYGCISGYPDGTFRGNRALSRYEFAAGLNTCLQQIEKLIAASSADLVSKDDLATLQRLIDEFGTELGTLRGRVDTLEARTSELEAHQFSTTTKLGVN